MTPLLRTLANPHRLEILCALSAGELSVGELQVRVPLSQSALSQHLARLRAQQMVATRRQAQTIYYRIADAEVLVMAQALLRLASGDRPTIGEVSGH
jgi:DNA-binding transcriptional ArsR family regulator